MVRQFTLSRVYLIDMNNFGRHPENAINAAFHDPRISPLTAQELDKVDIEVSILTEPKPLAYRDSADLLEKLCVNEDGVIIRKGTKSATFLPQVWEQPPRPEDFLSHLCRKAGLPYDTWKKNQPRSFDLSGSVF